MREVFFRFFTDLFGRAGAPFTLRLILLPLVASIVAYRAGVRDAREGRAPYLGYFFRTRSERRNRMKEAWKDVAKIFILAVIVDFLFQLFVLRYFFPLDTLLVALAVAVFPYLLVRSLVQRMARWKANRSV